MAFRREARQEGRAPPVADTHMCTKREVVLADAEFDKVAWNRLTAFCSSDRYLDRYLQGVIMDCAAPPTSSLLCRLVEVGAPKATCLNSYQSLHQPVQAIGGSRNEAYT